MKTTKILFGALRVSALVALFAVMPAQAQTVNVSFLSGGSTTYSVSGGTIGTYTGLGAAPDLVTDTYWNDITGPYYVTTPFTNSSALLTSAGVVSTVGFTLTNPGHYLATNVAQRPSNAAPALFGQWISVYPANSTPADFTISGLSNAAGVTYNLYLYSQDGSADNAGQIFTVNGVGPLTATGDGSNPSSFVAGNNYVEFTSLTANGSGDISGTFAELAGGNGNDGFNGFQIQEVITGAPEPSTLATMSLAGMALLVLRKRFKKQSV